MAPAATDMHLLRVCLRVGFDLEMADLLAHHIQLVSTSSLQYVVLCAEILEVCPASVRCPPHPAGELTRTAALSGSCGGGWVSVLRDLCPASVRCRVSAAGGAICRPAREVDSSLLLPAAPCQLTMAMRYPGCPLHAGQVLDKLDKHTSGDVKSPGQAYEEEQVGGSSWAQRESVCREA